MSIIEWNENFSVGFYAIDEQHKELFILINNIMDIIKEEDYTFSNLFDVVNRLDYYINEHFKYEEDLMDSYAFLYKDQHIKEHNFARNKVSKINIFNEENFEEKFFKDTLLWLIAWLTRHIMITDKMLESCF